MTEIQGSDFEDERPWTMRFLNGPAAGLVLSRNVTPEDAQWVQRNRAEWERVRMAMAQRPDAERYVLSALYEERREAEYAWDQRR